MLKKVIMGLFVMMIVTGCSNKDVIKYTIYEESDLADDYIYRVIVAEDATKAEMNATCEKLAAEKIKKFNISCFYYGSEKQITDFGAYTLGLTTIEDGKTTFTESTVDLENVKMLIEE